MDSFEINNGGYDLSALRRESTDRQSIPDTVSKQPEPKTSQAEPKPAERIEYVKVPVAEPEAPRNRNRVSDNTKTDRQEPISVDPEEHRTVVTLTRFFADGRLRIFFGILLILIAGYMLAASISFLSSNGADQSIIPKPHSLRNSSRPYGDRKLRRMVRGTDITSSHVPLARPWRIYHHFLHRSSRHRNGATEENPLLATDVQIISGSHKRINNRRFRHIRHRFANILGWSSRL